MARSRVIAVVTGSRAEFGLLEPVMRAIKARRGLSLRVIVAGAHLVTGTWRDVKRAGLRIDAKVPMQMRSSVGRIADAKAVGRGIAGFARAFAKMKPDVVLVLGDRIEPFAAASTASIAGIRVAHLHGGDRAEGVADEAMRHAISKLAHLHFPATATSRKRLIAMGEPPQAIWNVGSPAIDGLRGIKPAKDSPEVIVIQHPVGESDAQEARWMRQTLAATKDWPRIVFAPNTDPGSMGICKALRAARIKLVEHMPRPRFLQLLAGAKVIVGNSSAGLIEAAALNIPCVNIGPRQAGREAPANVTHCHYGESPVRRAVQRAMKPKLRKHRHPYGGGRTGQRIARILAAIDFNDIPLRKHNTY